MTRAPIRATTAAVVAGALLTAVSAVNAASLAPQFEFEQCLAMKTIDSEHPLGWPCKVLNDRPLVVRYVNHVLEAKGFNPEGVTSRSPRQLQLRATKDGRLYRAVVVQSGPKVIALRIVGSDGSRAKTYRFNVAFEP